MAALRQTPSLVLEAPPGAGKTTRVPVALLEAGLAARGEILVLQPRRIATRLAARFVAAELGERVGDRVGYQVRFEDVSGPKTRIKFVTEGILTRRLLSDPQLRGVDIVVLDEFHERHLSSDLALALLRRLQQTRRPELRIVVMSATLEAAPIAAYLDAPRLRSEGRRFEVSLEHLQAPDTRFLDQQVLAGVKRLWADGLDGDLLVFLPGSGEIRRAQEALEEFASRHGIELHALHGDLPPGDQDRAVTPSSRRKIILSTNVAETSVTIEGVAAVLDSGLARVASHSPWSGLPVLELQKVSKASAIQRAGRAGRTRAGRCLRLYTQHDYEGRPQQDAPEIQRLDLTETVLSLRAAGETDLRAFPFFERPSEAALQAADTLLQRLGAIDARGQVTPTGKAMLRFPVHPRQARIVVEAERRGVGREGAGVAALIGERDIRKEARTHLGPGRSAGARLSADSDLIEMLARLEQAEDAAPGRLAGLGLEPGSTQAALKAWRQLGRGLDRGGARPGTEVERERALLLAILTGYPDRVARRRRPNAPEVVLCGGGTASLAETSVVHDPPLLVTVDAEERRGAVIVRVASRIEADWLLDLYPDALRDSEEHVWNAEAGRVERISRIVYEQLALEETRSPAPPSLETGRVLAQQALARGLTGLPESDRIAAWLSRLAQVREAFPEAGFPAADEAYVRRVTEMVCFNLRNLSELERAGLPEALGSELSATQAQLLSTAAPEHVTLPGGRRVRVHYEPGKAPWIESRLQDFFGMAQGPVVMKGRVPLVLHLLAPNQREVQVTTDLAGFWERHYPALRRELMRKYPRHAWPEDPRTAAPPQGGRIR